MEYTLIWDTVNTASRIADLCKRYSRDIIISAETAEASGGYFDIEFIDDASLRGKKRFN